MPGALAETEVAYRWAPFQVGDHRQVPMREQQPGHVEAPRGRWPPIPGSRTRASIRFRAPREPHDSRPAGPAVAFTRPPSRQRPHAGSPGERRPAMMLTIVARSLAIGLTLLLASPFSASAIVQPPDVNPDDFGSSLVIDNRYFPLVPGTVRVYIGEEREFPPVASSASRARRRRSRESRPASSTTGLSRTAFLSKTHWTGTLRTTPAPSGTSERTRRS